MKTDRPQKPSFEQLASLAGFIVDFLATILNFSQVSYWLGHKNELKKKLREVFSVVDEFAEIRTDWQKFYKEKFNWDVDFSLVLLPPIPTDGKKWRLLFIPKGMTMNLAFHIAQKLFPSWKYFDNLDESISDNVRKADGHYAVWVRDSVEPDEEFLGKSTREADPEMKIGITHLERIIFEVKYFSETSGHLDVKGLTFCSGSRSSDGDVPCACLLHGGKFRADCNDVDDSDSEYGIRRAVSL